MINVKVERVWIGIGSNLLNPKKQVSRAIWALSKLPMTRLITFSSCYRSRPLGQKYQPDYLNMIAVLDTNLFPEVLLDHLQYIELQQGRIRNSMIWESRTLDLDILLFGKDIILSAKLIVPHYDILNREFIIYPLMELDNNMTLPSGRVISDCARTVSKNGLIFWKDD